jgi:TetR/AcrR family transcriptional regulator, tetracycline repressor protein
MLPPRPAGRSRPGPNRRLTRADVVAAAAAVAERGLVELTMPAVAKYLGVTPMALYQHVDNKDHLLSLLLSSQLAPIEVPPPSQGKWDTRLRAFHLDVVAAMTRFPGLVASVARAEGESSRLLDGYLQILLDGGFDPATAGMAYTGLYYLAMGVQNHRLGPSPAAHPPTSDTYAATSSVSAAVQGHAPADWHEFALDTYLDGLRTLLRGRRRAERRTARDAD